MPDMTQEQIMKIKEMVDSILGENYSQDESVQLVTEVTRCISRKYQTPGETPKKESESIEGQFRIFLNKIENDKISEDQVSAAGRYSMFGM